MEGDDDGVGWKKNCKYVFPNHLYRSCLFVACCRLVRVSLWAFYPTFTCPSPPTSTKPDGVGGIRPPCQVYWPTCCGLSTAPSVWCVLLHPLETHSFRLFCLFVCSVFFTLYISNMHHFFVFSGKDGELHKPDNNVKVSLFDLELQTHLCINCLVVVQINPSPFKFCDILNLTFICICIYMYVSFTIDHYFYINFK